jgi:hypothetical protein
MMNKNMSKAYSIAEEMLKDKLKGENPDILEDLERIRESDVIVTAGQYDFIERVFSNVGTPHKLLQPQQMGRVELNPDQIVFANCPGNFDNQGLRALNQFVRKGGFLFTTDWSLQNVLEKAFPGFVQYNQNPTRDEVVRVELLEKDDPFLKSIIGPKDDPQWWLEGSSYPIEILKKNEVDVLVKSKELKNRYGQAPVFITFDYGEGRIYHMISHFYLQRAETRTQRQQSKGTDYLFEKGINPALKQKYTNMNMDAQCLGEIEAAYSSSAMLKKVIWDKRKTKKIDEKENNNGQSFAE